MLSGTTLRRRAWHSKLVLRPAPPPRGLTFMLLALPPYPLHPATDCAEAVGRVIQKRDGPVVDAVPVKENPFAVLAALRDPAKKDS